MLLPSCLLEGAASPRGKHSKRMISARRAKISSQLTRRHSLHRASTPVVQPAAAAAAHSAAAACHTTARSAAPAPTSRRAHRTSSCPARCALSAARCPLGSLLWACGHAGAQLLRVTPCAASHRPPKHPTPPPPPRTPLLQSPALVTMDAIKLLLIRREELPGLISTMRSCGALGWAAGANALEGCIVAVKRAVHDLHGGPCYGIINKVFISSGALLPQPQHGCRACLRMGCTSGSAWRFNCMGRAA